MAILIVAAFSSRLSRYTRDGPSRASSSRLAVGSKGTDSPPERGFAAVALATKSGGRAITQASSMRSVAASAGSFLTPDKRAMIMIRKGSHSIDEFRADAVRIECPRCSRAGSYRGDGLFARFELEGRPGRSAAAAALFPPSTLALASSSFPEATRSNIWSEPLFLGGRHAIDAASMRSWKSLSTPVAQSPLTTKSNVRRRLLASAGRSPQAILAASNRSLAMSRSRTIARKGFLGA